MDFSFLCKKYVVLKNKLTLINKNKQYFEFTSNSVNFPGNSGKIAKLFLNDIFNLVGRSFCCFLLMPSRKSNTDDITSKRHSDVNQLLANNLFNSVMIQK